MTSPSAKNFNLEPIDGFIPSLLFLTMLSSETLDVLPPDVSSKLQSEITKIKNAMKIQLTAGWNRTSQDVKTKFLNDITTFSNETVNIINMQNNVQLYSSQ
jgi:hypothetical protein